MKHLLNAHYPIISKKFNEKKHSSEVHSNKARVKCEQYNKRKSSQKCRAPTNIGMIQYLHYSYFSKQLSRKQDNFLRVCLLGKRYKRYAISDGKKEQDKP